MFLLRDILKGGICWFNKFFIIEVGLLYNLLSLVKNEMILWI